MERRGCTRCRTRRASGRGRSRMRGWTGLPRATDAGRGGGGHAGTAGRAGLRSGGHARGCAGRVVGGGGDGGADGDGGGNGGEDDGGRWDVDGTGLRSGRAEEMASSRTAVVAAEQRPAVGWTGASGRAGRRRPDRVLGAVVGRVRAAGSTGAAGRRTGNGGVEVGIGMDGNEECWGIGRREGNEW